MFMSKADIPRQSLLPVPSRLTQEVIVRCHLHRFPEHTHSQAQKVECWLPVSGERREASRCLMGTKFQ